MSGGGQSGRQTQVSEPWAGAQPYLLQNFSDAARLSNARPSYYGGNLTVGELPSESSAFQERANYADSVFGQSPTLRYGDATGALPNYLNGNTTLGQMTSQLAPGSTSAIGQSFARGPSRLSGDYSINPSSMAPVFGTAGGLDARPAYERMLSGTPDYAGAQGAVDAANAPILRQFEQEILPGLNERATFLNNPTGGYKTLSKVLPDMSERMATNAQTIMNNERLRALDAQQQAAGAISAGGLQSYGLGLDASGRQAGLNLQADSTNADLLDRFRADTLNYGSLGGQLASTQGQQGLGALGMYPSLYQMGASASDPSMQYAQFQRGLAEDDLAAQMERFNYLRDQPFQQQQALAGILQPGAGLGGSSTTVGKQPGGSRAAGALGGALTGAQMGSSFGPWGTAIGAILGGAGGYFL
jgi:hypothetical protein